MSKWWTKLFASSSSRVKVNTMFEVTVMRLDTGEFHDLCVNLPELISAVYRLANDAEEAGAHPAAVIALRSFAGSLVESYTNEVNKSR